MKYIEYADNHGIEMLGSDSIRPYDNRLSNRNALKEAFEAIQKQANAHLRDKKCLKPRQCYARITQGIGGQALTEWHSLENPIFQ
jgi:hypothetical protein